MRFKLAPAAEQEALFRAFAGTCRAIYNAALELRDYAERYRKQTGRRLNYVAQARELTQARAEIDWVAAVSQTCEQQALRDLDQAFQNFFAGRARYPKFRRKGENDGFRFQGREVSIVRLNAKWSAVRLPKIGQVKFRRTRDLHGRILNATVSLTPSGWHISFACEIEHKVPETTAPSVGIDRGVATALALSTGERLLSPETFNVIERRRRKAQRVVSRRKRGSKRYAKARVRVAKLHARSGRIRRDWLHRTSTDIARRFGTVVLEDLKIANMTASAAGTIEQPGKNVCQKAGLNRAILSQGWGIFATLLAYKLEERGGTLIKVDPAYTSQTCSDCGAIDRTSRKNQAEFVCVHCGHRDHADTNAAINIVRRNTASMLVEGTHQRPVEART